MKNKIRKLSVMIIVVMCLCMINVFTAEAKVIERGSCSGSTDYELDDQGVLTISGWGTRDVWMWPTDNCRINARSVVFNEGIGFIGSYAFQSFENLISVSIPDGLKGIEHNAFDQCKKLASIVLPDTVEYIDEDAFNGCYNLLDVYYSGTKEEWKRIKIAEYGNDILKVATIYYEYEEENTPADTGIPAAGGTDSEPPAGITMPQDTVNIPDRSWLSVIVPVVKTGWEKNSSGWYYFDGTGQAVTDWLYDNGSWYFMDDKGLMQTGWVYDNRNWYYLYPSGAMATGWVLDGEDWYYLSPYTGAMQAGWVYDNGSWYYLNPYTGAMVTGDCLVDGIRYSFGADGAWIE